MNDALMIAIGGSFAGSTAALIMFWGAFQTMRYQTDSQVPAWVWAAIGLPCAFGLIALLYSMFGVS